MQLAAGKFTLETGGRKQNLRIDSFEPVAGETQDFYSRAWRPRVRCWRGARVRRAIGGNLPAEHKWLSRKNEKPPGGPAALLRWPEQDSGPMVPMVVGADQLVSHLLLLG